MKKILAIILLVLLIVACEKKEEKLELFSPEAFAYSLDNGWELNASCQVKGFIKKDVQGKFGSQISFELDLKMPNGSVKKNVQRGKVDQLAKEDVADLQINTQVQLDSTYKAGKYILIFNAKDSFSGKTAKAEKEFEL